MKTKVNPLKLIEPRFELDNMKDGRYVKRYFFSNGLGASVASHRGIAGGDAGCFEVAIMKYPIGTTPENTCEIIYDTTINHDLGCIDVNSWLDFSEVADMLQRIRNYNTGEYGYDK